MNIDSIIFDLDGTLWNAVEGVCGTWKQVLKNYPEIKVVVTPEKLSKCMGLPIDKIGEKLFPDVSKETQLKLMHECCNEEQEYLGIHGGKLYPEVENTLKRLSEKYKLFIVSNCQDGYIQCFFKAHKLDRYFTDFESWGATGLSKGENNKLIMKRNNVRKSIYVGDAMVDKESAKVAEIPFVYARYGLGTVDGYDYVIDEFKELLSLVQ